MRGADDAFDATAALDAYFQERHPAVPGLVVTPVVTAERQLWQQEFMHDVARQVGRGMIFEGNPLAVIMVTELSEEGKRRRVTAAMEAHEKV